MPTLSSTLVKHQVASVADVEEALGRQAQYGGDLITNLLELATIREATLTPVLAETLGLQAAPIGELPRATDTVRRLVPSDLAQRYALYPLEERDGELAVAVAEPLPAEVENDMAFSLGVTIVQRAAPLVRVRQALARDYGIDLDQRSARVLEKLGDGPNRGGMPSERVSVDASGLGIRPATLAPPPIVKANTPEPPVVENIVVEPVAAPTNGLPEGDHRSLSVPRLRAPSLPMIASMVRRERQIARRPRRLGPYTAVMAEKDLLEATTREDVLEAFFDFASQYFEYSALFAVHGDIAEGREAHGPGATRAKLNSIGIPLDLPSALSEARDAAQHRLGRLGSEGMDGALVKDLERQPGRAVLLLPVRLRSRCVLILYGDHGVADVLLESVGAVISMARLASSAIERLIVKLKHQHDGTPLPPMLRERHRMSMPSNQERAQALASALETSIRPEPEARPASAPPPKFSSAPPAKAPSAPPAKAPSAPPAKASSAPPAKAPSAPPRERRSLSEITEPPPAVRSPHARPVVPISGAPQESNVPASIAEAISRSQPHASEAPVSAPWTHFQSEQGTKPGVGSVPPGSVPPPPPETPAPLGQRLELVPEPDHSEIGGDGAPDIAVTELTDDEIDDAWDYGFETPPSSRVEVHAARPLPPRANTSEHQLPSVIVDLAKDCQVLLDRLLMGDLQAADQLLDAGSAAVTVLVGAFPGPLHTPSLRPDGEPARASECGPILNTLSRFGKKAVPFLAVRTNDSDPIVRRWATHLLGELPSEESAHAIARRFFDSVEDVRKVALAAGRLLLADSEVGSLLVAEFGNLAESPNKAPGMRAAAVEALAELRAPWSIPILIRILGNGPDEVMQASRRALSVITRQDFGLQSTAWAEWWRGSAGRHRIEWLIDALTHESQDIRRSAGEELKAISREYFGYYDDLPPRERERAQSRYREWWETKGKARFR